MSRKPAGKPYWEMTTEELREATKEFDEEFVADKSKPLTAAMRAKWERVKAKAPSAEGARDCFKTRKLVKIRPFRLSKWRFETVSNQETIAVHLDKALLERCTALAKKKRIRACS